MAAVKGLVFAAELPSRFVLVAVLSAHPAAAAAAACLWNVLNPGLWVAPRPFGLSKPKSKSCKSQSVSKKDESVMEESVWTYQAWTLKMRQCTVEVDLWPAEAAAAAAAAAALF